MNLVSVRELAKADITTTFYKNHAELQKGAEVIGGAIAQGDTSLYVLTYLWATGDGDASDTTPAAPSESEPWMVHAVNGITLPHLEEAVGFDVINSAADDFWLAKKHFAVGYGYLQQKFLNEYLYLMPKFKSLDDAVKPEYIQESTLLSKSLDDTVKPEFIRYLTLLSKLYQSDKTGGGVCCNNKSRDGSVHIKAHLGPDPDGMNEADVMKSLSKFKSLDDTVKPEYIQYSTLLSKFYQNDKTGGGVCCNNKSRDGSVHIKAHLGPDPDGMNEV